jgi:hypothetical protein
MSTKNTGSTLAALASDAMQDGRTNDTTRRLAGSVLSQANGSRATSEEVARLASEVLQSNSSSNMARRLAGSALSQSKK